MPRPTAALMEEKFARDKDRVRRLEGQLADARREAGRVALAASRAGVRRSRLASIWGVNVNQIDVMLTRARNLEEAR